MCLRAESQPVWRSMEPGEGQCSLCRAWQRGCYSRKILPGFKQRSNMIWWTCSKEPSGRDTHRLRNMQQAAWTPGRETVGGFLLLLYKIWTFLFIHRGIITNLNKVCLESFSLLAVVWERLAGQQSQQWDNLWGRAGQGPLSLPHPSFAGHLCVVPACSAHSCHRAFEWDRACR